jgi:predicted DNA-binding protein
MRKEYDFSKAERGRFYRRNAELRLPIYLGSHLQKRVETLAARTGRDLAEVVNQIVETEMGLIDDLETQKEA